MVKEAKPKVYCPSCSRLLAIPESKGEGDEMACPFCLVEFALEISRFYEGRITKASPLAVVDEKTPAAWRKGGAGGPETPP
ncbi:MAG: hypothetical protein A2Y63_04000 [Candidatus Riflebacteria bacterium RBG_13_59_9]|nr:MAG: hypothetical protein A2Y63_04000 [Candidatus Riflebacteria bacterium RBG_13_59_9]